MLSPSLSSARSAPPSALYTITTITHRRRPLFADSRCAQIVSTELAQASHVYGFDPQAWVIMPDHVHIVVRLADGSLSKCMQRLKSVTARAINAALAEEGPVWQVGFFDSCIRNESALIKQASHVIANPLRRGLVANLNDYPHWWCRWIERPAA